MIGAPQADMSPTRAAGRPPIRTVGQPGGTIAVGGCTAGGGKEQICAVPTVAAGCPAISTVGTPGGPRTPGCPVGSPTLAAGGIPVTSSVDPYDSAGNRRRDPALELGLRRALERDARAGGLHLTAAGVDRDGGRR